MAYGLKACSCHPLIHLGQEEQVRVKCLAQENPQPWDHEFGALPLT